MMPLPLRPLITRALAFMLLSGALYSQEDTKGKVTRLKSVAGLLKQSERLYFEGRFEDATSLAKAALDLAELTYGTDDPVIAAAAHELAGVYLAQARASEALALLQRALPIRRARSATRPDELVSTLNQLGRAQTDLDMLVEAEAVFAEALALAEKQVDSELPTILHSFAGLRAEQGDYDEALALAERALQLLRTRKADDTVAFAALLNTYARIKRHLGQRAEALSHLEESAKIMRRVWDADHPFRRVLEHNLRGAREELKELEEMKAKQTRPD